MMDIADVSSSNELDKYASYKTVKLIQHPVIFLVIKTS